MTIYGLLKMLSNKSNWCGYITIFLLIIGVFFSTYFSPPDYQQGEYVRIMYLHVPISWWALILYSVMAVSSTIFLITRAPLYFYIAKIIALNGLFMTSLSIVSGALWGKVTWGTWWVWDARLTSMLILWFLYVGYIKINYAPAHNIELRAKISSVLAVIGLVNLPIIKWSVNWWYTLHQPASIMRFAKPAIDTSMLYPLLIMTLAFGFYNLTTFLWQFKTTINGKRNLY